MYIAICYFSPINSTFYKVGMFNRQSILVIDGKIRLFLWQDQIIPVIDGIDGKTGTKVISGRPAAQLTQSR
jgi:hypothetical protein